MSPAEYRTCHFHILHHRRHAHQTFYTDVREHSRLRCSFVQTFRRQAVLACFSGNIKFQKHILHFAGLPCPFIYLFHDFHGIYGLDQISRRHCLFHFIFLKMSLQVPDNRHFQTAPFVFQFLHTVFSHLFHAKSENLLHIFQWMKLRHRHKSHVLPVRRTGLRSRYPLFHNFQLFFYS